MWIDKCGLWLGGGEEGGDALRGVEFYRESKTERLEEDEDTINPSLLLCKCQQLTCMIWQFEAMDPEVWMCGILVETGLECHVTKRD